MTIATTTMLIPIRIELYLAKNTKTIYAMNAKNILTVLENKTKLKSYD